MLFCNQWLRLVVLCMPLLLMGSLCDTGELFDSFMFRIDPEKYNPQDYTENLTQLAQEGKLLPVFGRQTELRRLKAEVNRGQTVLLVGPPGVGKTSLMGQFAQDVPQKTVWRIDLVKLVTLLGAKANHVETPQWLHFIRRAIAFHKNKNPDAVFLLDEIQTIFAGFGGGKQNVADAMKALFDEYPGLVLATTSEELAVQVLPRTAGGLPLARRVRQIILKETLLEPTVAIVNQVLSQQSTYCRVGFSAEAVQEAAKLSALLVHRIAAPGNALALVRQACNRALILGKRQVNGEHLLMEAAAMANQTPDYVQNLAQSGALHLQQAFYNAVVQDKHKIDEKLRLGELIKPNLNPSELITVHRDSGGTTSAAAPAPGSNQLAEESNFNHWIVRLERGIAHAIVNQTQYASLFTSVNRQ